MGLQFLKDGSFTGTLTVQDRRTTTSQSTLLLDGKRTNGTDGAFGEIIFLNNGDSVATVAAFRDTANDKGSLVFQTQNGSAGFGTRLTIGADGNSTFKGNISVEGITNTLNTGNSGTFVTNDANNYPRITTADATAQLGLFRSGGSAGGMYIGADSGGFEVMTSAFSTKFSVDNSGNGTFQGNIYGNSSDTTEIGKFDNSVTPPVTAAIKRVRMSQGGEIHFGDTEILRPLGITEGDWNVFGDNDYLSIYARSKLNIYSGTTAAAGSLKLTLDTSANFFSNLSFPNSDLSSTAPPTNFGVYNSEVRLIDTPNGGLKKCRVITDNYGEWIVVGRFAASAMNTIANGATWGSVSGLSLGTAQNETTEFSADFGDSFPEEVRIMGATDFTKWRDTRSVDFVYKVPEGRKWKFFFSGGATNGMTSVGPNHDGNNKFGWNINGSYDGFGRWANPIQTSVGMSDGNVTNPSAAYTTATANAFAWDTSDDAKITVTATRTFSGQDSFETAGFGNDDNIYGFFDQYPDEALNMRTPINGPLLVNFSSAAWVLIKLPEGASGSGGSGTNYWAADGNNIYNTNSADVTFASTAKVGIGNPLAGETFPKQLLDIRESSGTDYPKILVKYDNNLGSTTAPTASLLLSPGQFSSDDSAPSIVGYRTANFSSAAARSAGIRFNVSQNNAAKSNVMQIAENGNVSIGNLNSSIRLDVYSNGGGNGTANKVARFVNITSGATSGAIYIGASSGVDWLIGKNIYGVAGQSYFQVGNQSGTTPAITISSGSSYGVGIGINTPGAKIDIKGASGSPAISGTTQNGILRIQNASNNNTLDIGQITNTPFGTWLQAADKSDLDPAYTYPILLNPLGGRVGIGTTSPSEKLQVKGNICVNSESVTTGLEEVDKIEFKKSHPNGVSGYYTLGEIRSKTFGGYSGGLNFYTGRATTPGSYASTFAMAIDNFGRVGIGEDNPSFKLTVDAGSDSGGFSLKSSSSAYTATFIGNTGTGDAGVYVDAMNGDFVGNNYGFVGQKDAGYMEYNMATSSPAPYHYFANPVGVGKIGPRSEFEIFRAAGSSGTPQLTISTGESSSRDYSLGTDVMAAGDFAILDGVTSTIANVRMRFVNGGTVIAFKDDNTSELGRYVDTTEGGSIKRIRMRQGGEIHFGDTATSNPCGITEGNWDSFGDSDWMSIYARNRLQIFAYPNGSTISASFVSGTFTAVGDVVAFGSPSDKRLKENIKPIESALDKVSKLQGVTFDWKESDSILDIKEDIGFIAQDVQKVIPELVRENEDGMLSMRHQGMAPILLEAIKELKAEIEELKSNKCNCNK